MLKGWELADCGHQKRNRERSATWSYAPKVRIDYCMLRKICKEHLDPGDVSPQSEQRHESPMAYHDRFMREYGKVLQKVPSPRIQPRHRLHFCNAGTRTSGHSTFEVPSQGAPVGTSPPKRRQTEETVLSRLQTMASIVKKIPLTRSNSDIEQLARHLSCFPDVLPSVPYADQLRLAVASRAISEVTKRESCSLPSEGGIYLILEGKVERISNDPLTKMLTSTVLEPGASFGELQTSYQVRPNNDFQTRGPCTLLRITSFDLSKATEQCLKHIYEEKVQLVNSCPFLQHVSPVITVKLAEAVVWDLVREGTEIAHEGESIERVGFIKEGTCAAYMKVPDTAKSARVLVGTLKAHDCISEAVLQGTRTQPHTVVATSMVKIGWVPLKAILSAETEKHVPGPGMNTTLPIYDKDKLKQIYAKHLISRHWKKIKSSIVEEVVGSGKSLPF